MFKVLLRLSHRVGEPGDSEARRLGILIFVLLLFCRFGYVEYDDIPTAQAAQKKSNGKEVDGRNIRVNFAKAREGGGSGRGGFRGGFRGDRGGGRGGRGGRGRGI